MPDRRSDLLFELIKTIGHGGQADVWLARNGASGLCAVKVLREAWDPTARANFRREVERQLRVAGPNVARVLAYNLESPRPFVVLEYMPRGSLADELSRRGRVPAAEAIRMVRQIAHALVGVHARGLVHRDLKPGNVLLTSSGGLVLNDFGVAATVSAAETIRASHFVGTAAYAAPEQWRGEASPKSDVYALGLILCELISGTPGARTGLSPVADHLLQRLTNPIDWARPCAREAVRLLDEALERLQPAARRASATTSTADLVGIGLLLFGGLVGAAVAAGGRPRPRWDASVGRYRDEDGRFVSA